MRNARRRLPEVAALAAIPDIEWILKDVSFTVEPGQTVAIVGHTGAGKTTLTSLMMRFYDVTAGQILVDGVDLRQQDLTALRQHFAVVLQDPFLFTGTLAENIRLGNEEITDDDLRQAARDVNVLDFIESLPGKFDEPVQERGNSLSTGQKQLINFARALAYNPAHPHPRRGHVERGHRHRAAHPRRTGAHGRGPHQRADRPPPLHRPARRHHPGNAQGAVARDGSHQQLLAQRGLYWKLYQLQYKDQESRLGTTRIWAAIPWLPRCNRASAVSGVKGCRNPGGRLSVRHIPLTVPLRRVSNGAHG